MRMRKRTENPLRIKKLTTSSCLCLVALMATLTKAFVDDELPVDFLQGVRYRNETLNGALEFASMAGGMQIFIDGAGFDEMVEMNTIFFDSEQDQSLRLNGPAYSLDDQIQSAPTLGILAYTVPSLPDLYQQPMEKFANHYAANNNDEAIRFVVKVHNDADSAIIPCPGSMLNCRIRYRKRYTPMLHDISPSNVYLNQRIDLMINAMAANNENIVKSDADPVDFIKFSGTRNDFEDLFDNKKRLAQYRVDVLPSRAGDQPPGSSIPEVRFRVGNAYLRGSSKHCNFAGDDCWYVKTHPKIDNVSKSSGYITGGQELTITGWGLKGNTMDDVKVNIDGVKCKVTSNTQTEIKCVTGETSSVSRTGVSQPGSPGLSQYTYITNDSTDPTWSMRTDGSVTPNGPVLQTAMENIRNQLDRDAVASRGWFKAPETGNYRFYISCDDQCKLFLNTNTPFNKADPKEAILTERANRDWATEWRHYFITPAVGDQNQYISDWVALTKGEFYKIEGYMIDWGWGDHFTVSVEFEKVNTVGMHHANKEIQVLTYASDNSPEEFIITVENATGKTFQVQFVNPLYDKNVQDSKQLWKTEAITDNISANSMRDKLKIYFEKIWGSAISVVKVDYDSSDVPTTTKNLVVKSVYTVKVRKCLNSPTFTAATIIKETGLTAIVTIGVVKASSEPIGGKFKITCPDPNGKLWSTPELNYNEWTEGMDFWTQLTIPHLQFKIYIRNVWTYEYKENGISFAILFQDYNGDAPQCYLESSVTNPITGANPTPSAKTIREYGKNLMFEPIPLEFLYTDVQQPQVTININGIDGLCPDFNCDYNYVQASGEITGQSLSGKVLTIDGTNLPTKDVKVQIANSKCISVTAVPTQITCTLDFGAAAGSWDVKVISPDGLTPKAASVTKINVQLTVSTLLPGTNLNQLGGDILTITGQGFDQVTENTSIVFSDTTTCALITTSATQVTCLVTGFDSNSIDTVNPYSVTITVNGVVDSSKTVKLLPTKQSGVSVSPTNVSPVLSSVLTVTLESTYPETLTVDSLNVVLVKKTDVSVTRPLYVISVDDAAKTIKIKYPGADSGDYFVQVTSKSIGRIDKSQLALKVYGKITNFSPLSGSALGGTLITINGENFSTDPLDNPVKVGKQYCLVETSTLTQIVCRTMETSSSAEVPDAELIVFLRTSEEAQSDVPTQFAFVNPLESMTDLSNAFDATTNTQVFTITGTGFVQDNLASVSLFLDGKKQETLTVSTTDATFKVTEALDSTSKNVRVYFADGLPTGFEAFKSATMTPTLVSVSPFTGSSGGTLLTVTGTGFGVNTKGVTLWNVSTNKDACKSVQITAYGTFTCLTNAIEIKSTDILKLKTASGTYACGNTLDSTKCFYVQLNTASPTVTSVSLASPTVVHISGLNFPTSDFDAILIILGVESDVTVINDATQITATFTNGVPVSTTAATPSLRFVPTSLGYRPFKVALTDTVEQRIAYQTSSITLTNKVAVSASTTGLRCSFQGGCSYTVTANGLTSTLKASSTSKIEFCGQDCVLDEALSDSSKAVCTLPCLATSYSASQYEVVNEGTLIEGTWSGTASKTELAKLIDRENMVDLQDTTKSNCYFQIKYTDSYVGVLNEVKFFITELIDKTPFVGGLKFQGSDDGITFTDLWTIDETVHEGWNSHDFVSDKPSFNIYRFQGKQSGSCRVGEVRLYGIESIDSDATTYSCTPKITLQGTVDASILNPVIYDAAFTPVLTGMSTRFGSVLGNEPLQFTGTGFSASAATTVKIDNRDCVVSAKSATSISCTTSNKPYKKDVPTLVIQIEGKGYVATKGKVFRYVSKWSSAQTWGFDIPPQEGYMVNIPKGMHLLVDVDSTPILSAVNVEGSLIFPPDSDPNHLRTFDAHIILVKGGYMEIGTEEFRYTSKLTITMHSKKYSPRIPIFGNKCIGVHYGTLEMHGVERSVTWTDLKTTAEAGATSITLNDVTGAPLDWKVGEEIVIASTDYSGRNAEQRKITSITNTGTNPVITFDEPLLFKHYAGIQKFGASDFIEMRAEIGLLTRNVKYQGDPETSEANQYGAIIIMHSPEDESTTARIDSIELTNVGQAFILGSYPIHFHMIGTVQSSYIRNNAIHHTFNRAVTIHGVHYLRVENNVAYHTMGHTIFIEDAIETKNYIVHNLVVDVRRSWSLLNTDQTPACFWITNPNNIFVGNHAAGSDRYSYWFDLQETSIGPSFNANICPINAKLGEFRDNVAHSNGRYGLRIFHGLVPRTYPCEPMVYDPTDPANPYPKNPLIVANFYNLVSYKNKRNGAIAERVGGIMFHNFKTADNLLAGIEFSLTDDIVDGWTKIVGGLVIGRTENTEDELDNASPRGIIGPRTEGFRIEGTKFYNYNWNDAAALGDCSHCFHPAATDSGARTIVVSDLLFDDSVTKKIRYEESIYRGIFYDETGTLTGRGPKSWGVANWKHLQQTECIISLAMHDGLICDSTVQVRRVVFHNFEPKHFTGMEMKIAKFDSAEERAMANSGTLDAFLDDQVNYSWVPFRDKANPGNAWAMPYVTGHRYRVHWRRGLDFEEMQVSLSERWAPTDLNTFFNLNFTETREAVNFTDLSTGKQIMDQTMLRANSLLESGDNYIVNETAVRQINFVVNGKNPKKTQIFMEGLRCISGTCQLEDVVVKPLEPGQRLWSDPNSWEGKYGPGKCPGANDEVQIPSGWNMLLDLEETPIFKSVTINGRLSFIQNDKDIHLHSKQIFVRAGEFFIGSAEKPFENKATITLHGMQKEETLVLSGTVSAGNKILATSGDVFFYGKKRDQHTRLIAPAYKGQKEILVEAGLDWAAGDWIYIAPTALQHTHSEYRTIVSYVGNKITLNETLSQYHWGADQSTADKYNGVDMRGEVLLLTRNILVRGDPEDNWGGQVLVTDIFENDGSWRKGQLIFDYVQVYNCSQEDTFKAALRWEEAIGGTSRVSNSAVHGSLAWLTSVYKSNNVELTSSTFVGARAIGMHSDFVRNYKLTNNFIGDVSDRIFTGVKVVDKQACVAVCSYHTDGSLCQDLEITGNTAFGCLFAGFIAPGHDCGVTSSMRFKDNVSHSNLGVGAAIYPDFKAGKNHRQCYELSHFSAYKTILPCVGTHYAVDEMRAHDITCIDTEKGISLQTGGEGDSKLIKFYNSFIFGETEAQDCPQGHDCYCPEKFGLMLFGNNVGGKSLHIPQQSPRPIYKIKTAGAWGGEVQVDNVVFSDWLGNGKSACLNKNHIFARNPFSSDKIPVHKFANCKFNNVNDESIAYFDNPEGGWANLDDCGQFPCTAPNNILMTFTNTKFTGITPASSYKDFQMIPDDPDIGGKVGAVIKNCEKKTAWEGYICRNRNIAYLVFESLDSDKNDRSIQPIYILNEKTGFNNTLNSMMDHVWDGFYTGQIRLSRFPTLITTDGDYTIEMSGTPPKVMRFKLDADLGGVKLRINYPVAGSIQVYADNVAQEFTSWSKALGTAEPLKKIRCGENRYVGVENFLEFYITPTCEIRVEPRDAIMTKVRLEWTLKEFYADGGVNRFVDRLAASLGISAYRISTVAVYYGSVVVEFAIDAEVKETKEQSTKSLAKIKQKLTTQVKKGTIDLGAPVLGLQADGELLAGTPIPDSDKKTTGTKNPPNTAIIGDGANLWDKLNTTTTVTPTTPVKPVTPVDPTTPATNTTQDSNGTVIPQNPQNGTSTPSDPKKPVVDDLTKLKVSVVSEGVGAAQETKGDTSKFVIIIPSIVGAVLVVVAIAIIVRMVTRTRVAKILVDGKVENHEPISADTQAQYILGVDEKNNIFTRNMTSAGGQTNRAQSKGKQDQDNVVQIDGNEDAFRTYDSSMHASATKFDLSSTTLQVPTKNLSDKAGK